MNQDSVNRINHNDRMQLIKMNNVNQYWAKWFKIM